MIKLFSGNNNISFMALPPKNYKKIDNYVSRSGQPSIDNLEWLKEQGVTDVVNFRTNVVPGVDFVEEDEVKKLGMTYHNIPLNAQNLKKFNNVDGKISNFFELVDNVKNNGKKLHIHCMAGADRTGLFSLLYKCHEGIDNFKNCADEMIKMGHNQGLYPNLINFAKMVVDKFKK